MVSNNTLAALILVAIVISLVSIATTLNIASRIPITLTGGISGTTQVSVATAITITLPVSTVNFGSMSLNAEDDTTDNSPGPFIVQNDGSVCVNVTVNATQLWSGTGATGTSTYYRFKSECNEADCVPDPDNDLVTSWTNMPINDDATKLVDRLRYTDSQDTVKAHIYLKVPADESAGSKSSTVTFTSEAAGSC
ncbi:MAG: hypothetical protein QXG26_02945 [Candidatus Aenigmatarchaeota archaeon]